MILITFGAILCFCPVLCCEDIYAPDESSTNEATLISPYRFSSPQVQEDRADLYLKGATKNNEEDTGYPDADNKSDKETLDVSGAIDQNKEADTLNAYSYSQDIYEEIYDDYSESAKSEDYQW